MRVDIDFVPPAVMREEIERNPELAAEYMAEGAIEPMRQTGLAPKPCWELYDHLYEAGSIVVARARINAEKCVGFASLIIGPMPHWGAFCGTMESLFVLKRHRGTGAGRLLIYYLEQCATARGCKLFAISAPSGGVLDKVLAAGAHDMKLTNHTYTKALTQEEEPERWGEVCDA